MTFTIQTVGGPMMIRASTTLEAHLIARRQMKRLRVEPKAVEKICPYCGASRPGHFSTCQIERILRVRRGGHDWFRHRLS